jgi:hypothetical protein
MPKLSTTGDHECSRRVEAEAEDEEYVGSHSDERVMASPLS